MNKLGIIGAVGLIWSASTAIPQAPPSSLHSEPSASSPLPPSVTVELGEKQSAPKLRAEVDAAGSRKRSTAANRLEALAGRASRADAVLVVPAGKPNPSNDEESEQDMRIMAHLLQKVINQTGEEDERKAMGIALSLSSRGARHLFIEGYGAIFTFSVQFPLAPAAEDLPQTVDPVRNEWEKAGRDLYGRRRGNGLASNRENPAPKYKQAEIDALKQGLIGALKNGSHIRHLKPDDRIVVVLTQSNPASDVISWKIEDLLRSGAGDSRVVSRLKSFDDDASETGSTLKISVRKGDIDALFRGIISDDDFRHTASIVAY